MRRRGLVLVVMVAVGAPVRAQEGPLKGFDDYAAKALKEWDVPGVAVAVVKDDAVVHAKGYGVRKRGDSAPVGAHTVFAIGSISKSFTAASVGMLVDEGKVKWDDPASKYLAGFRLRDPFASQEMTVRDLLCHRSGLDRHEMLWYGSSLGRDEIIRRLRLIKPDWSFRGKFGYQNVMYLAAGQVVPAVTGKSWDEFVRRRIFMPLGMTETNTSVTQLSAARDVATPHEKVEDKVVAVPWRNIDNVGPAGSINSTVTDMAQWVRLHLAGGKRDGKQLLSSAVVREMQTPQTVIPVTGASAKVNPYTHLSAYGLGWMLHDYRGRLLVEHGGAIDGMRAQLGMIPEEKVGVVVLSNCSGTDLPTALMRRVLDAYLHVSPRDWSGEYLKVNQAAKDLQKKAEKKREGERVAGTKPSLPLARYAGTYRSAIYDPAKVTLEKGKLVLRLGPSFTYDLEHWHFDTFRGKGRDPDAEKRTVRFELDAKGKVKHVRLSEDEESDLVFDRAEDAPAIALAEAELKKFVGKYELKNPPLEMSVELVAGKLKATVTGQPALTIVPVKPTRFKVEGGPEGLYAEFAVAGGKVKSVTIENPSGVALTLQRK